MVVFNVIELGAVGDGVRDNSTTLARIFNFADRGDTIYFPNGTYLISETLYVKKGINLLGESWGSILLRSSAFSNTPTVHCNNEQASVIEASSIDTLLINGAKSDTQVQEESVGIYIENTENFFLKNICVVNHNGSGIKLDGGFKNSTIEINDSYIRHNNGNGVHVGSFCADIHIFHCDIGGNQDDNIRFQGTSSTIKNSILWGSIKECGLRLNGNSNHISECQIEGNARHAIVLSGSSHSSVRSNKIYASVSTGSYGVYAESRGESPIENILIQGNMIYSSIVEGWTEISRAIYILPEHKNFKVFDNNLSYLGIGNINPVKRPYALGLEMYKGDQWNNIDDPLFVMTKLTTATPLVSNKTTPLIFDNVQKDLSNISSEGYFNLREDGIYQLSGEIHLNDIPDTNKTALRLDINGKLDETIIYYEKNTPSIISFSSPFELKAGSRVTLNIVTIGEEGLVNLDTRIKLIKNH